MNNKYSLIAVLLLTTVSFAQDDSAFDHAPIDRNEPAVEREHDCSGQGEAIKLTLEHGAENSGFYCRVLMRREGEAPTALIVSHRDFAFCSDALQADLRALESRNWSCLRTS